MLSVIVLVIGAVFLLSKPEFGYEQQKLIPAGTATIGNINAKVVLVEFSDFQCPACRAYQPTVDLINQKYGDRLLFAYRHFPLPQHQYSRLGAEAFEAAGEQGKYWEMYDYLFTNQDSLAQDFILNAGAKVGIDQNKYQERVKANKFADKIQKDWEDGQSLGINGTPTFFLNGKKISLKSPDDLQKLVEQELAN